MGTQPDDCVFHRLRCTDQRVVVAKQPGSRLQDVAMERGLGERIIVEGPERRRVGRSVRIDSAQQQPGQ